MFGYLCILAAFILARISSQEYRAIAYIVFSEFLLHKIFFVLGVQLTDILDNAGIHLAYAFIEMLAIVAIVCFQSHIAILAFILINLGYNVLTISQFSMPVYDFHSSFGFFVGGIMILELLYLGWITKYVADFRRKHGLINTKHIDMVFFVRGRSNGWLYSREIS